MIPAASMLYREAVIKTAVCSMCSMKKLNGVGVMGLAIGERVCLSNRVNLKGLIITSKDSTATIARFLCAA